MGGISVWQLAIIALIIAILFGTRKLSTIGSDVGSSVKDFKKALSESRTSGHDLD
ncbi:twin argininte translocase protein A [Vibrio mediterranei AK1]|nr:twin argininte translocase protein A [Vibrio mediterranei AK1]